MRATGSLPGEHARVVRGELGRHLASGHCLYESFFALCPGSTKKDPIVFHSLRMYGRRAFKHLLQNGGTKRPGCNALRSF